MHTRATFMHPCFHVSDIKEVIHWLQLDQLLARTESNKLLLEFRRDHVLEDALRHAKKMKFSPRKWLKVH